MGSLGLDRLVDVQALDSLLGQLALALTSRGLMLTTAESCTGGMVASACTSIAGSSDWFERGFVTYSNEAKAEQLGVPGALIARHGAVSGEVAMAMALGALQHSRAQVSVAITGIAGPGGGTEAKPVGTVWFGFATGRDFVRTEVKRFRGDRSAVRSSATKHALQGVLAMIDG
jgi:nicotinamide-nucleotide amidase